MGSTLDDPLSVDGTLLGNSLQPFERALDGTGNLLRIFLDAELNGGTEAVAFRHLELRGNAGAPATPAPAPASVALLGWGCLWAFWRFRRPCRRRSPP